MTSAVVALLSVTAATILSVLAFASPGAVSGTPAAIVAAERTSPRATTQPAGTARAKTSGLGAKPITVPPSAEPAASAVAVRADGVSKSALQFPHRLKAAMTHWAAGSGGSALTAVTAELANVAQIGGSGLYPTMKSDCTTLRADITAAQVAPPIPDPAMQKMYRAALGSLASAAGTCRSAITAWPEGDEDIQTHVNKPLLRTALVDLSAGAKKLYTATEQIRILHH